MIMRTGDHIKVEGYWGTWYVIDAGLFELTPDTPYGPQTITINLFLIESEEYGNESPYLIVDEECHIIMDDVYDGFFELEEGGWERLDSIERQN